MDGSSILSSPYYELLVPLTANMSINKMAVSGINEFQIGLTSFIYTRDCINEFHINEFHINEIQIDEFHINEVSTNHLAVCRKTAYFMSCIDFWGVA
jgi:hypothetical protein